MSHYETFRNQLLENNEGKKEYDALHPEYDEIRKKIEFEKIMKGNVCKKRLPNRQTFLYISSFF